MEKDWPSVLARVRLGGVGQTEPVRVRKVPLVIDLTSSSSSSRGRAQPHAPAKRSASLPIGASCPPVARARPAAFPGTTSKAKAVAQAKPALDGPPPVSGVGRPSAPAPAAAAAAAPAATAEAPPKQMPQQQQQQSVPAPRPAPDFSKWRQVQLMTLGRQARAFLLGLDASQGSLFCA